MRHALRYATFVVGAALLASAAAADTWTVDAAQADDSNCVQPTRLCKTIVAAVAAALSGDTLEVLAGTYNGSINLTEQLTLTGAQAGVSACGRTASESVITGVGILLELDTGSAGAVIDGFTFDGGTRGIESDTGPIDNLEIRNNRFVNCTTGSIFLNDPGMDITVHGNDIDGTAQASGGSMHLDGDAFPGFHFTKNCVHDGPTGFFCDGIRNVDSSPNRDLLLDGNVIEDCTTGMNSGSRSFENGIASNNVFRNNDFDGWQGGPLNMTITLNTFEANGRVGLSLTSFGNTADATRGAQFNQINHNCFTGNGFNDATGGGVRFGNQNTNEETNIFNDNNLEGNTPGLRNSSDKPIDAQNNWWGAADGPSGIGPGSGDAISNDLTGSVDFDPWLIGPTTCLPPQVPTVGAVALIAIALGFVTLLAVVLARRRPVSG